MIDLYAKAGAFLRETVKGVWKQFDENRIDAAQMATLIISLCNQQTCMKRTTTLHTLSVARLVKDSEQGD